MEEIGQESGRNGNVTDRTESGRPVRTRHQSSQFFMTPAGRVVRFVAYVVLVVGVLFGIYRFGRAMGDREVRVSNSTIQQLRTESQKISTQNAKQAATITDLQANLKKIQAKLDSILPSENTYNITPNQSLIVADGRLTVGLIGSPANQNVNINVNGKPYSVPAGDTINIALDASTACQVTVQSFDMFMAVLHATCAAAKPK
jgi:cell division protein FtsB